MACSAFIPVTAFYATVRPYRGVSEVRIVIFLKNKKFAKIFCVCHSIFFKPRQILLIQLHFKICSVTANIGDDHHKYGKSGTKHELIDQLQS